MIFGGLLFSHGIAKWSNFDTMSTMFPDPLGIGSSASLSLAIFGEVICSLGFIVGAFYRLALIPMIFTMCIAFFVIHGADPFVRYLRTRLKLKVMKFVKGCLGLSV